MATKGFVTPSIRRRLRAETVTKFNPDRPTIIFTSGPTGSGKSSLPEKVLDIFFKKSYDVTIRNFLIDDYVESSDTYKNNVKDIIRDLDCNKDETTETCNLNEPSKALLEAFGDAYFDVRQNGPCGLEPNPEFSCKLTMLNQIIEAIQANDNILIETTGKKIPIEYLKTLASFTSIHNYNVLFVYAIVTFETLMERNKTRASRQMKEFIESNYENPAPRLPDISFDVFKKSTANIEKTLITLRNKCMRLNQPSKDACGPINNDGSFILLIFNNDDAKSKLIYDSRSSFDNLMSDREFITYLQKYHLAVVGEKKSKQTKKAKRNSKNKLKHSKKHKKKTLKNKNKNRK